MSQYREQGHASACGSMFGTACTCAVGEVERLRVEVERLARERDDAREALSACDRDRRLAVEARDTIHVERIKAGQEIVRLRAELDAAKR